MRNPWAWCTVAAGLVVYTVLANVLVDWWVRIEPAMPWPVTLLLPPAVYAVLLIAFVRPLPWPRCAAATAGLWMVHLALGMVAVAFVALMDGHYAKSRTPVFPPPPVPQILWVPLLLFPLRDLIAGREAPGRAKKPAAGARRRNVAARPRPAEPMAAAPAPAIEPPVAVAPPAPAPAAPAPPDPPVARREPAGAPVPERPASVLVRPAAASVPPAVVAGPSATQQALEQMLADDPAAPSLRIPFGRIQDQFPAEVFRAPHAEVAAALGEPGAVLVPQRLALQQLEEGVVRIAWDVVASQFPRDLLAVGDEGIRRRLADGQIVLPLDEVVRQVPAELFMPSGAAAEPEGLDGIPDIFLVDPPAAPPAPSTPVPRAPASPAPVPPAPSAPAPAPAVPAAPAPAVERAPVVLAPAAPMPVPPAAPRAAVAPEAPPVLAAPPAAPPAAAMPVERPDRWVIPDEPVDSPETTAWSEPAPAEPAGADDEPPTPLSGIAQRLSPLVPLDMASTEVDGVRLLTLQSPVLDPYLAVTAAHVFVPLVSDPRAPWPIEQVTLRGEQAAVVLTPLGGPEAGMLVAAVPRSGTLALLELVCRRQARASHPAPSDRAADLDLDAELIEVEPSTRLRRLASDLGAVGPVSVSALRDPEGQHALYLFLPDGSDVHGAGGFTAEIARALRRVGQPGTFDTVILRGGRRRMVIHRASADDTAVVAAAGETRAPGLAHRQIAQVAGAVRTS